MKKFISLFIFSILFFSCGEKQNKIELISNYNAEYYSFKMVESVAVPLQQNNPQPISFAKYIKKIHQNDNSNKNVYYPLSVRFYINEKGKIDKVGIIDGRFRKSTFTKMGKNGKIKLGIEREEEIIKLALSDLEKLNFKPATLFGKKVKVRADVQKIYFAKANGDVVIADSEIKFINQQSDFESEFQKEQIFFVAVEEMPEPIGGIKAIQEKIQYPEIAKRAGIEGRVFVKAFIDEKGNVTKAEIIKGLDGGCDDEAKNAVMETKFTPGRQRGKAVKVQVTVPILFKLDSKSYNERLKEVEKQEVEKQLMRQVNEEIQNLKTKKDRAKFLKEKIKKK